MSWNRVIGAWLLVGVLPGGVYAQDVQPETEAPPAVTAESESQTETVTAENEVEEEAQVEETSVEAAPAQESVEVAEPAESAVSAEPSSPSSPAYVPESREEPSGVEPESPLQWHLNGYFRTRLVSSHNVPGTTMLGSARQQAHDANYGYMRLRLNPSLTYGTNEDMPIAALRFQLDGLDNVVFGDNARVTRTPIFGADPSNTDLDGFDLRDSLALRRAWLEFLIPVGQLRVGRMPSNWGFGILSHDGNGLGDWGDPNIGATYDRVLFATRPITVYRGIASGDTRSTPLILALAYDKLVEDPVVQTIDPPAGSALPPGAGDDVTLGPLSSRYESRTNMPFGFLTDDRDDVTQMIAGLAWIDPDFHSRYEPDEFSAGVYFVYRDQESTNSEIYIVDGFWRLHYSLSHQLRLFTEGEVLHIGGETQGVTLTGSCSDDTNLCARGEADIWGWMARVGAAGRNWTGQLEAGHASGDGALFNDPQVTMRPLHPDYRVGMVMYPIALAAVTADRLGESIRPLWSRGGVWNSTYFWPQIRYEVLPGIEVHAAFLIAWADELLGSVLVNNRPLSEGTSCGLFDSECLMGWEVDLALRVKWGPDDLMRWDTEAGIMRAGDALFSEDVGLSERILWTLQTRIGMQF